MFTRRGFLACPLRWPPKLPAAFVLREFLAKEERCRRKTCRATAAPRPSATSGHVRYLLGGVSPPPTSSRLEHSRGWRSWLQLHSVILVLCHKHSYLRAFHFHLRVQKASSEPFFFSLHLPSFVLARLPRLFFRLCYCWLWSL